MAFLEDIIKYKYSFSFNDGRSREFNLTLHGEDLVMISEAHEPYPDWTRLEYCQCPNCPLDPAVYPNCPIAVSLIIPVEFFMDSYSYEEVEVTVKSPGRTCARRTSLQEGLSSMIGIYMVTNECPMMDRLKPMVRFHMPFADADETIYRVISTYLLAQYLVHKRGGQADWGLTHLIDAYNDIMVVNRHFVRRLRDVGIKDASLNSVVRLDNFARALMSAISMNVADDMRNQFSAYLDDV